MSIKHLCLTFFMLLTVAASLAAQVKVKRGAVVYTGSASNTTAPATVNEKKLRKATPEWQKIQDEDIDTDSARGKQLIVKMNERIRRAVRNVATAEHRDMVTRKKDLKDALGREVVDLTQKVVDEIES